jgi:hypothetical protein
VEANPTEVLDDLRADEAPGIAGFDAEDGPIEPSDERRRRNNRLLVRLCVIGAAFALAIGVGGIVLIRAYLDDAKSPDNVVSAKYQRQYRDCVHAGGVHSGGRQRACADRTERQCLADPHWTRAGTADNAVLNRMAAACLVGPDRTG